MTEVTVSTPVKLKTPWQEFWHSFVKHRSAFAGMIVLIILMLIAIFAPLLAPYSPTEQFNDHLLQPPAWHENGSMEFILGTDDLGRDLLSRLIYGTRISLFVSLFCVSLALTFGLLLGIVAGMSKTWLSDAILRVMDIMLALPTLLLAIIIVSVLGPNLINGVIAIAIVYLPHFVRITRGSLLSEINKDYVKAAKLDGFSKAQLVLRTLLPNMAAPLIIQVTLSFSSAILDLAALGFIGLGARPPTPEWGTILSSSRAFIEAAPWTVTFPGLAILVAVLASNLMGDGFRDSLDPRLKG